MFAKILRIAEAEKLKKRGEGVLFEDYALLSSRIDKMESSMNTIVDKVDTVLSKLDNAQNSRPATSLV